MNDAYKLEAIHSLGLGNVTVTDIDIQLLAEDLEAIAIEDFDEDESTTPIADLTFRCSRILRQRIGGWKNLESYMRCLRVPNRA